MLVYLFINLLHYISIKLKKKKEKRIRIQSLKIMTIFRDMSKDTYHPFTEDEYREHSRQSSSIQDGYISNFSRNFHKSRETFLPPDFPLSVLPAGSYAPLISSSRRLLPHGSRLHHVLTTPSLRIFSHRANSFFLP